MAVDHYLPEDLLPDILNRVPVKTVLQCTSVCKSWYSLITSPRFINTYPLSNIAEKQVLVWNQFNAGDKFFIHKDNDTFDRISNFNSPFRFTATRIVSSCNGLICICIGQRKSKKQDVFLWNPNIRRFYQVPLWRSGWGTIGFGFVSATNEFKVVNIRNTAPGRTAVFELGKRCWKNIDNCKDFLRNYEIASNSPECVLNDTVHWVGSKLSKGSPLTILTFDMKNDKFGVLQVPSGITGKRVTSFRPMLFQESFALMQMGKKSLFSIIWCCIWVMNEYGVHDSWTKHFSIDLDIVCSYRLLGFRHNGDMLLARHLNNKSRFIHLVSYDPKRRRFKSVIGTKVNRDGTSVNYIPSGDIVYADYCVQSLVLLEQR